MTKLISPRLDDPNKIIQNLRDHKILKDPIIVANTSSKGIKDVSDNIKISQTFQKELEISGLPSIYNALYVIFIYNFID